MGPGVIDDLVDKPVHHSEWARGHRQQVASHLRRDGFWRDPLYFGCNSFVDPQIRRVFEATYAHAPDNTWTNFTSDHRAMMGAHQLHDKGPAMYEEITLIPLIIKPPGGARMVIPLDAEKQWSFMESRDRRGKVYSG